jgi:Mg-chelatase subunit ChlD
MLSVDSTAVLLLAPLAAWAAWWLAVHGRRGRRLTGAAAALSAALIVAALAGIYAGEPATLRVFLVDVSASTQQTGADLLPHVRSAAGRLEPTDRAAVVVFGRDAEVLISPTPVRDLPPAVPEPLGVDQDGTSVERALELALALFAETVAGDIVLITDGRETTGDAAPLGAHAASAGRPVHSLTLRPGPRDDAWVAEVRAPESVPAGRPIDFEVILGSTVPLHGKLVLLANGREAARPEPVDLTGSRMVLARRARAVDPGLLTLTARLVCPGDVVSENDEASAAVRVRGRLAVTYVSAESDRHLAAALASSGALALRRTTPEALSPTNRELLASDVVVLDNVPAGVLGPGRLAWLRGFVVEAGRGLVVFGGPDAFGPGGYAETELDAVLPVDPDPERRAAQPSAVAIVVDRSGSMAERIGDRQKIEFVREALLRAGREFGARKGERSDVLSVIAFHQMPELLLERERVGMPKGARALRDAAARLFPSGRTNIRPALDAAIAVLRKSMLKRHLILVSDGRSQNPLDGGDIARRLKARAIVLSVLATDERATRGELNPGLAALKEAAAATEGRFVALSSIADLPDAMARTTRAIAGSLVREAADGKRFEVERGPGAWMAEIDPPPPVRGYVLTGPRRDAPPLLVTDGAPLVAVHRRGLGRVAACTTSLDGWAEAWAARSAELLEGLVLWAGGGVVRERVDVELEAESGRIRLRARAAEPLGDAELTVTLFRPDGRPERVDLRRVGRLRYEADVPADVRGTYVAKISDTKTGLALGEGHTTVGYSAEWRPGGDRTVAARLSHVTSGRVVQRLGELPPPTRATGADARRNLAYVLLGLGAALFLFASLRG